jgi:hypothetical protein
MTSFLQAVADRAGDYVPGWFAKLSNKYPEFSDLLMALGILYYQKYDLVQKLRRLEEQARRERERTGAPAPAPVQRVEPGPSGDDGQANRKYKTGERNAEGVLVV